MTSEFLPHLVYKYFESHRGQTVPDFLTNNGTNYSDLSYIDSITKPLEANNESSMKGYVRYSLSGNHPSSPIIPLLLDL